MKKRKVKRYQEGGEAELKARGLESSKGDKVGFFERLRMGNIDDPRSEAYRRFGAGRAKMDIEAKTPVPEMSSDYSGRGAKSYGDDGMNVPHSLLTASRDEEEPRTLAKYMRSSPKEDESSVSMTKEEVKVSKPRPRTESKTQAARKMGEGYMKASETASARKMGEGYMKAAEAAPKSKFSDTGKSVRLNALLKSVPGNPFGLKKGGKVSSASSRADGIAQRGKTRGRIC